MGGGQLLFTTVTTSFWNTSWKQKKKRQIVFPDSVRRPSHLFYFAVVVVVVVVVRRDLIHNDSIFLLDFGTLWKFIAPRLSSEGMESIRNEFGFVFEVMQSTRVIRNFFFIWQQSKTIQFGRFDPIFGTEMKDSIENRHK